jgi:hypothetical protein
MNKTPVIFIVVIVFLGLNILIGYLAFAEPPDYLINATPESISVYQGNSSSFNLNLTSLRDFESKIMVGIKEAPDGVEISMENDKVQLSNEKNLILKMNVKVDSKAPAGLYDIVIEANGNGLLHSVDLKLNIIGTGQIIVIIQDFWYFPNNLTVRTGSEIIWINRDLVGHTATADNGEFDTNMLQQNQASLSIVFDKVGVYPWFCVPHPQMVGAVKVIE